MSEKRGRARWVQNGEASWLLKMTIRDGGAVLATVHEAGARFFVWSLKGAQTGGWKETMYAAQRAARKALRQHQPAAPELSEQPLGAL